MPILIMGLTALAVVAVAGVLCCVAGRRERRTLEEEGPQEAVTVASR